MKKGNIETYLEIGKKRTAAGAVDWPGWCRIGRSEEEALAALAGYGERYSTVLAAANIEFQRPSDVSQLVIVERLEGNATTDFGAPGLPPTADDRPVDDADHERLQNILRACWQAFDQAVEAAENKTLKKGPRGGGRELEAIIEHVLGADSGYLSSLGWKFQQDKSADLPQALAACREAMLAGLAAAVRGEIAAEGPRGGKRWSARYFVRRAAWHELDHAWEIEDRIEPANSD